MEFILNLGWLLLSAWMACMWFRLPTRSTTSRRGQLIALGVAILILLPVISVTDDLVAAQNPAETSNCLRSDDLCRGLYTFACAAPALPLPAFSGVSILAARLAVPSYRSEFNSGTPALAAIQNRPPPAA